MYLKRNIEPLLTQASKEFCCITIYGSRQVGKETLVKNLFGDFNFISLDDFDNLSLALSNPKLFLESNPTPLIIDEIQKAPNLLPFIKQIIDEYKFQHLDDGKNELLFVLTGSNQFQLKHAVTESLAGRTAIFHLSSLSFSEIKEYPENNLFSPDVNILLKKQCNKYNRSRKEIFEDIFKGGMPEYINKNINRETFFNSYVQTYLERDVKELINSSNLVTFNNFLKYIALRTASQVDYTDISNAIGINTKTVKEWLSILESSGIIIFLEPYMKNASNRIVKTPKLYFMDTGLCAYLCKWPNAEMLENGVMNGAFYETYVVSEMIKNYSNHGLDPFEYIYYYRDRDQKEVDLIIETIEGIYPIEIKKGINPVSSKKSFSFLSKYNKPLLNGLVIDSCDRIMPINENIYYCPIAMIGL